MANPFILRPKHPAYFRIRNRKKKEVFFRIYGAMAIVFSLCFLALLLGSIFLNGISAFKQTQILVPVYFDESIIDPSGAARNGNLERLKKASYGKLVKNGLKNLYPVNSRRERAALYGLISKGADRELKDIVISDPSIIGKSKDIWMVASSDIDMAYKGKIDSKVPSHQRRVSDLQFSWMDDLGKNNKIRTVFNKTFFVKADSREPEMSGILGALMGSVFVIIVCFAVALPIGVGAAIYMFEFAPKNRLRDIIELSINNLAAVPSIVYGLLAVAIYLHLFNMPRSAPLVGGLALALLILPIIVVTARTSLAAVSPSIRDAALGLGASRVQAMFHHVLPLAMPGIMTGAILSLARALGETAPLLMIGMVAFIADVPAGITDPATALPVQIYLWSDSPEIGFKERTSAAIIVLLGILIVMNGFASWLRKKYEKI